jgi:hypothetical protein
MGNDTSSTDRFYREVLQVLGDSGIPFLIGGAFALAHYSAVERTTKDIDVFVRPGDCPRVLEEFSRRGYGAELTFPHWLGKVFCGEDLLDVIFSSGNGICTVDDRWLAHSSPGAILGVPVRIIPAEEMIWSKAYVMERDRFDGADILHLLRARGPHLDWDRLRERFAGHGEVLLAHLVLFHFVYPSERQKIPPAVMEGLLREWRAAPSSRERVCRGTLLSRMQYGVDIEEWGYRDARLLPPGSMTPAEVAHWQAAAGGPAGCER